MLALASSGCFLDRTGTRSETVRLDAGRASDAAVDAGLDAAPTDRDGDGIPDATDVCPDLSDPDQGDLDGDGLGDACDDDRDGDGIPDDRDLCPGRDSRGTPDEDRDGIENECDACPLDPDPLQANADRDRLGDACEDADPSRFSRVALLETFSSSFGTLVPDGPGMRLVGGAVEIDDAADHVLARPEDPDHPGTRYAVHVTGHHYAAVGTPSGSGTMGVLLRWNERAGARFGYRLDVLAARDRVALSRHDGGGCGPSGMDECVTPLIERELGLRVGPDTEFVLRATAFDSRLSLSIRSQDGSTTTHLVSDFRHSVGGVGLWTREAHVRFHALAIYAP